MRRAEPCPDEELLLQQCLAGDAAARLALYQAYHPRLLAWIDRVVRAPPGGSFLAEEIAGNVRIRLFAEKGRALRAYDPARGPLLPYLGLLARDALRQHVLRQARWPCAREVPLQGHDVVDPRLSLLALWDLVEDLSVVLPPGLHAALRNALGFDEDAAQPRQSSAAQRKQRQRAEELLRQLLDPDGVAPL
jgi:hypothetical protein